MAVLHILVMSEKKCIFASLKKKETRRIFRYDLLNISLLQQMFFHCASVDEETIFVFCLFLFVWKDVCEMCVSFRYLVQTVFNKTAEWMWAALQLEK